MTRALLLTPLLLAAAMSAQVPTPPKAPTTPHPMMTPVTPVAPWVEVMPSFSYNYDLESKLNLDISTLQSYGFDKYASAFDSYSSAFDNYGYAFSDLKGVTALNGVGGPVAWAQSDPADSLYRQARDQFNRGDYRRAAELFKSLPQKFTSSAYVADAQYYQAFSLYRIGGTPELQEALAVLEARKQATPEREPVARGGGRTTTSTYDVSRPTAMGVGRGVSGSGNSFGSGNSGQLAWTFAGGGRGSDAAGLAARIASVLSSRGLSNDAAVKRALAAGANACNPDDQSVKAEALSALMQNDPETGRQMAVKILANRDECSVPLRRNAVMLVGNKHDDAAASTLIPVAKSDPSFGVRMAALDYLIRTQTEAAINAVMDLARTDTSKQVQRAAVRALAQSSNARARAEVRTIVENNAGDESLRISVIDGLDRDKMTAEDATWLRGLYGKTTSTRIKERIVSALARSGGDANTQWLQALVRNEDESLDSRTTALERIGRNMDLAALNRMYDASSSRPIRQTILSLLSERKEPEALDKIVEVAKNGTDIDTRRQAINILSRSKDPRASKLLLQLVDH